MLAGALLASASSAAVPDEGITMAAAFDMAKETAPALLTSKYQVDIAVADRDISRAKSLPQLSLFGQWSENKIEYDGPLTGGFHCKL